MQLVVQFEPKYGKPIDSRFSVKNREELDTLGRSAIAYPFMKVVNEDDGLTYELSKDKTEWVLFTAKGPVGPPPKVEIGTVSSGDNPTVNLVLKEEGVYTMNIVLPNGDIGPAPEIRTGDINSGDLKVDIVPVEGEEGVYQINMTIPSGKTPTFKIGTVEVGENPGVELIPSTEDDNVFIMNFVIPTALVPDLNTEKYNTLETNNKTVIAAINELLSEVNALKGGIV